MASVYVYTQLMTYVYTGTNGYHYRIQDYISPFYYTEAEKLQGRKSIMILKKKKKNQRAIKEKTVAVNSPS